MNAEKYPVISSANHSVFEFLSEGPNGTIKKIVRYQKVAANLFNLAFGDWDEKTQLLSELARSNNDDRDKILSTVAFTIFEFKENHSGSTVIAQGATCSRTRLYQIGIKANWKEISFLFLVRGLTKGIWSDFELNKNYDAFSITPRLKVRFAHRNRFYGSKHYKKTNSSGSHYCQKNAEL